MRLPVITNLHPITHRFEVIAYYCSNLRFRQKGTPLWHTRSGWTSTLRTTKFSLKKLETSLCRVVLKYWQTIVSVCHNPHIWQTDGQMSIARPCICVRSRTVKTCPHMTYNVFGGALNLTESISGQIVLDALRSICWTWTITTTWAELSSVPDNLC